MKKKPAPKASKAKKRRREGPLRVTPETLAEAHRLRDLIRSAGTEVLPVRMRKDLDDGVTLGDVVRVGLALLREEIAQRQ